MRKSVSYLMNLKAELADAQQELHETAVDIEAKASDIRNITTEEARCESDLGAYLLEIRRLTKQLNNQAILTQQALLNLQKSFGFNTLQK